MVNKGDVNAASTTNVRLDGGKKNHKEKKYQIRSAPSEALTSHPPSTIEASDDELGEEAINVTAREKWVARVEVARQAVEILGQRMNVADGKKGNMVLESSNMVPNEQLRPEKPGHHSSLKLPSQLVVKDGLKKMVPK
ncbi:hypothetical protein H5410_064387 [Solanum commersonii]|uniref:Uncharacterized protein n=1 Tax=Solanum commersonii TaxID=4109 RepID=A0A9J5VZT0_SOLCO|nr:hypothetical protein H5410_064387 [Solanum commersonii]